MKKQLLEVREAVNRLIRRVDDKLGHGMAVAQKQTGQFNGSGSLDSKLGLGVKMNSNGPRYSWAEKGKQKVHIPI